MYFGYLNSLSINAKMIGIGKPIAKSRILNTNEFLNDFMKSVSLNIFANEPLPILLSNLYLFNKIFALI